jgi:hypothetical protein
MAKGRVFDEYLIVEFANRLHEAQTKKEKGEMIKWFIEKTGISKGYVYKIIEKLRRKESITNIAIAKQNRKSRKNDIELAQEKSDMFTLAAIKCQQGADNKKIPTERAIEIAESMGYFKKGKYTRSRADRLLEKYKINSRHINNQAFAHQLKADYPGHVVAVDATPIDHYYLTLDRQVEPYYAPTGDKHLDDVLAKKNLSKIWVYYFVDMYSKAFIVMPFASLPKGINSKKSGENADDWYDFLKFCLLPKSNLISPLSERKPPFLDCPVEGQPTILFCDQGSGIGGSKLIKNLCGNLGIKIVTHMPGHPSAKGIVEGRISAFKRSYESMINPDHIKDINHLIYFYQAWTDYHNQTSGAYDKWREGVKNMPIIRLTDQNFKDASVSYVYRVIDAYGCIAIDNKYFFVTEDESWRGEKVQVYTSYAREGGLRYSVLLDKKIVLCIEGKPGHGFEDVKLFQTSEGAKNREEVKTLSGQIKNRQIFEDMLPKQSDKKVRHLPGKFTKKEIHTPLVQDKFYSVKNAFDWVLHQNGLFAEEIPDKHIQTIIDTFEIMLDGTGYIDGDTVIKMSNSLTKYKNKTSLVKKKGE